MGCIIGIDLGTTNTMMAVFKEGNPMVIPNADGAKATPSIVSKHYQTNELLIGESAKRQIVLNPQNTIFGIKRLIGKKFNDPSITHLIESFPYKIQAAENNDMLILLAEKWHSPEKILSLILKKLKHDAEEYLKEQVTHAVITVPSYFNYIQRQSIKKAGDLAGIQVHWIMNETTAACLGYGFRRKEDKTVAIYRLGGGSFDISIIETGDGVFETRTINGNTLIGGDDFDQCVVNWICEEFEKDQNINLCKDTITVQRLKEVAEGIKYEISSLIQKDINLPYIKIANMKSKSLSMTLSRKKYKKLVHHLIKETIISCKRALRDKSQNIDEVILAGQQTKMPILQENIKNFFGKKIPYKLIPPEATVLGTAVQAGILTGNVKDILILEATPLSLGIEIKDGIYEEMIKRNTTIPAKRSKKISTINDNQNCLDIQILQVLQGNHDVILDKFSLGWFRFTGIKPAPRGRQQIEMTFDINANGVLNISAKDLNTGISQGISV